MLLFFRCFFLFFARVGLAGKGCCSLAFIIGYIRIYPMIFDILDQLNINPLYPIHTSDDKIKTRQDNFKNSARLSTISVCVIGTREKEKNNLIFHPRTLHFADKHFLQDFGRLWVLSQALFWNHRNGRIIIESSSQKRRNQGTFSTSKEISRTGTSLIWQPTQTCATVRRSPLSTNTLFMRT